MGFEEFVVAAGSGRLAGIERTVAAGPTLIFCHATGFCKEVWLPVIEELERLSGGWTAVAADQRLHGCSQGFPPDFDWWLVGADVLRIATGREAPVIGIGHSGGGAAIAMAEAIRPGSFAAALLIEPIILPPPHHVATSHPLADGARRRQRRFASTEVAYASYHGRGPFATWDDRALRAYVEGGFALDEGGVWLRCDPEAEAQFFLHASAHDMWDRLGRLDLPVRLVAGSGSDSHPADFLEEIASRMPRATMEVVPGATHFLPMERPDLVAARIAAMVAAVAGERSHDDAEPQQDRGNDL